MDRKEFAQELIKYRPYVDYVNPDSKTSWKYTYLIFLDTGSYCTAGFLVHASDLSSAYNEIVDYAGEKGYTGYFADEKIIEELKADAIKDGKDEEEYIHDFYDQGGNAGEWFCNMSRVIEIVEKRF